MISRAQHRYLGVSAQKTRLVVDQVRGKSVADALSILHFSPKRVARDVEKVVRSALANAQQKDPKLDVDLLVVRRAVVDDGPVQKRARHRSMGRLYRILKRTCHVTIDLDVEAAAPRRSAAGERR
jgi:large subunit ribosomal protein L22